MLPADRMFLAFEAVALLGGLLVLGLIFFEAFFSRSHKEYHRLALGCWLLVTGLVGAAWWTALVFENWDEPYTRVAALAIVYVLVLGCYLFLRRRSRQSLRPRNQRPEAENQSTLKAWRDRLHRY